ncbi:MAG: NUDIX hydrolase [Candidatus Promineifilaceae bacterium]|jgi:8-oxo-dGTP pyrophosphatase MutT (NUDIX family)
MSVTIKQIQQALEMVDFDVERAHKKMAPATRRMTRPLNLEGEPRYGGVLLLLYCKDKNMHIVLTRRRDDLTSHAGQISFPGGRNEPMESLLETALRETEEEVGVPSVKLEVLGALSPIYIPPSDFEVHPYVAWFQNGKRPVFKASIGEVAEIIEAPLAALLDPASRAEETRDFGNFQVAVPFFTVQDHKVWGATAVMLSEFIERLRKILALNSSHMVS